MTTTHPSTRKPLSSEIETLLASEPKITALTCDQLCQERANDIELLQDLFEFPVKSRPQVRASLIRSITAITHELKTKKCPTCSE